jgi:hypothetical protein
VPVVVIPVMTPCPRNREQLTRGERPRFSRQSPGTGREDRRCTKVSAMERNAMLSLWIQTCVRPPGRWSWTACLDRNDTDRTILSSAMPTAIVTGVMDLPASAFQPRDRTAVSAYSRAPLHCDIDSKPLGTKSSRAQAISASIQ